MANEIPIMRDDILDALARVCCVYGQTHNEMDVGLLQAMADEVMAEIERCIQQTRPDGLAGIVRDDW
jgi:hypothetical protein